MKSTLATVMFWIMLYTCVYSQSVIDFSSLADYSIMGKVSKSNVQFNGYTNHWNDQFNHWYRYGNLFKMAVPDVESTIAQSKVDIAEELGIPGLVMEEGFLFEFFRSNSQVLIEPSVVDLNSALKEEDVFAIVDNDSELGKQLISKLPKNPWPAKLKSHQYNSVNFTHSNLFVLKNGSRKLFVLAASSLQIQKQIRDHIQTTKMILDQFELKRGWFGAKSLLKSVTCMYGHPLETIGLGMNEGNSWFTFSGYMDFLMKEELENWLAKIGNPVIADVGFGNMYGCKDYTDLQVQDMSGKESWINYAKEKGGYMFRPVYDKESNEYKYDGYIASDGNKEQIDKENIPFVYETGSLEGGAEACMVLFVPKSVEFDKTQMWASIFDKKAVAVMDQGKMMGPKELRNSLQMLLLDREFLEEYFGGRIGVKSNFDGYELVVNLTNLYEKPVSGELEIVLPPEFSQVKSNKIHISLPGRSNQDVRIPVSPGPNAMANSNPVGVNFIYDGKKKSTIALLDLPRAISVQELLYGHSPSVKYPVTIHNFKELSSFPVQVKVFNKEDLKNVVFESTQVCKAPISTFEDLSFDLKIPPGSYTIVVSAMGVENSSQMGVGKASGNLYVYEDDINSDGVPEFRMENDSVRVTLLATGARVIEYIIKSKNENVLFKLWPEKPDDHRRPDRRKGFYPFGGFEDFLGQASMETHKVYSAEVMKKEGDFVRVKMTADYFGNKLEKIYTLYGNSPLLECRFALTFKNPEANVLGPQPILELGEKHWTEDVFIAPDKKGIKEFRMRPEDYYGQVINLSEGWNAGYDTKEDITFVGAFPVTEPLFLHMWMNHPRNRDANYYYTEFQPWVPIYQKSTMYFSYYLWASTGPWEKGVDALRTRNLITTR